MLRERRGGIAGSDSQSWEACKFEPDASVESGGDEVRRCEKKGHILVDGHQSLVNAVIEVPDQESLSSAATTAMANNHFRLPLAPLAAERGVSVCGILGMSFCVHTRQVKARQ